MKTTHITILAICFCIGGCGDKEEPEALTAKLEEENRKLKAEIENKKLKAELEATKTPKAEPAKELTLEEKIVGRYIWKKGSLTLIRHFMQNGVADHYANGRKSASYKWGIVRGEIHMYDSNKLPATDGTRLIDIWSINQDGSLTTVAYIKNGIRKDFTLDRRHTFKKVK